MHVVYQKSSLSVCRKRLSRLEIVLDSCTTCKLVVTSNGKQKTENVQHKLFLSFLSHYSLTTCVQPFLISGATNICSTIHCCSAPYYSLSIILATVGITPNITKFLLSHTSIIYLVIYLYVVFNGIFHSFPVHRPCTAVQQRFCNLYLLSVRESCVSDVIVVLAFACCCGNGRRNNRTCGSGACSM